MDLTVFEDLVFLNSSKYVESFIKIYALRSLVKKSNICTSIFILMGKNRHFQILILMLQLL